MHSLRACSTEHMQAEWKTKDSQQASIMWLYAHVLLTMWVDSARLHFACTDVTADLVFHTVSKLLPAKSACIAQSTTQKQREQMTED